MSIEYQESMGPQTRGRYVAIANIIALTVASFMLSGCNEISEASVDSPAEQIVAEPTAAERGGGVAIFNNGELVEIYPDGSVGKSCNVCNVAESDEECKYRASKLAIPLCRELIEYGKAEYSHEEKSDRDALASSQRTTNSFGIIGSARAATHDVKMCEVINKRGWEKMRYDPSHCANVAPTYFVDAPCYCWL